MLPVMNIDSTLVYQQRARRVIWSHTLCQGAISCETPAATICSRWNDLRLIDRAASRAIRCFGVARARSRLKRSTWETVFRRVHPLLHAPSHTLICQFLACMHSTIAP